MTVEPAQALEGNSPLLVPSITVAIAILAVNLYASQPLIAMIGADVRLPSTMTGFIPTATMAGYSIGMVLLVPLLDMVENRRLILATMGGCACALILASFVRSPSVFLATSLAIGVGASAIHMLVPTAAASAAPERRGGVIGTVQSGIVVGVLLCRPAASLAAAGLGWRWFYFASGVAMVFATALLGGVLRTFRPQMTRGYGALVVSLWSLLGQEPVLRRRTAYQVLVMAAFGAFWTAAPLELAGPAFGLDQRAIAVFALVGAAGIFTAPLAGRAGDRGLTSAATPLAHAATALSMVFAAVPLLPGASHAVGLAALALAAILVDAGFIADQTLGRREINLLAPRSRGRVNGLFTGILFVGGAAGSALAVPLLTFGGWVTVCLFMGACGAGALLLTRIPDRSPSTSENDRDA